MSDLHWEFIILILSEASKISLSKFLTILIENSFSNFFNVLAIIAAEVMPSVSWWLII